MGRAKVGVENHREMLFSMQEKFETFINGEPVKFSDKFELPEENKRVELAGIELTRHGLSGSLELEIEPNWLYLHQQKTGNPKLVKIMPW